MEQVKSKAGKKDSSVPSVERLSLRKEEQDKLESWVQELNIKFDGMIRLTKSDLANFLIRHHPSLSADEIALIEAEHFDEVRWLNWATAKIREAKKQGQSLTLDELLSQRKRSASLPAKERKKRAAKTANEELDAAAHIPPVLDSAQTGGKGES